MKVTTEMETRWRWLAESSWVGYISSLESIKKKNKKREGEKGDIRLWDLSIFTSYSCRFYRSLGYYLNVLRLLQSQVDIWSSRGGLSHLLPKALSIQLQYLRLIKRKAKGKRYIRKTEDRRIYKKPNKQDIVRIACGDISCSEELLILYDVAV